MSNTTVTLVCATIYVSLCAAQTAQTVAAGVISGIVRGADGGLITSGIVSASGSSDSMNAKGRRTSATAPIGSDGTFRFPPLDLGTYRICVQVPGSAWLDPCDWGPGGLIVSLTGSRPSVNTAPVLKKGALLTVRMADAGQLLATHEGKTLGGHLLLGVASDSMFFHTAGIIAQDGNGRNYQLLIPFDRAVNVSLTSTFFQVLDSNGILLPKSSAIPILVRSGQQPPTVFFRIAGMVAPK